MPQLIELQAKVWHAPPFGYIIAKPRLDLQPERIPPANSDLTRLESHGSADARSLPSNCNLHSKVCTRYQ